MPSRIITYAHRSKRPPHKKKAVPLLLIAVPTGGLYVTDGSSSRPVA